MPKVRVPNFFSIDHLTDRDHYHLMEGYAVEVLRERPSGKYHKNVWIDGDVDNFLMYIGLTHWWHRYEPNRSWWGRIWGTWKPKKT